MAISDKEKTDMLVSIEVLNQGQKELTSKHDALENSVSKHGEKLDEVVKVVHENSMAMKDSIGELSGQIGDLVTELKTGNVKYEQLKENQDLTKSDIRDLKLDFEKYKEYSRPILIGSEKLQKLKDSAWAGMSSKLGLGILMLILAGLGAILGLDIKL